MGLGGCDKGEGSYETSLGPPPELVAVRVGHGVPCTDPRPGERFCFTQVNRRPLFVLGFDRPMAVSSSARANFKITSGSSGNLEFLQPRVDPVERTIVFALGPTAPSLSPDTEYRLVMEDSGRAADRLASYDGVPFRGRVVIRFVTGTDPTAQTAVEPQPLEACAAISVLKNRCATSGCHQGSAPPMGLSFESYDAIKATAIDHASVLVQQASDPSGTGENAAVFPRGLPIIASGTSARSFLLFKVLLDARRHAPPGPDGPHPDLVLPMPAAEPFARVARELGTRVPGAAMPEEGDVLPLEELRLLRRWIDGNAPPCAPPGGDAGAAGDGG